MTCKRCSERVKDWAGSDPVCAFGPGEVFKKDNWRCATMSVLRHATIEYPAVPSGDHSVLVLPFPGECSTADETETHVVLHWYKSRGQMQAAFVIEGDGRTRPLLLVEAERLADYYAKRAGQTAPTSEAESPIDMRARIAGAKAEADKELAAERSLREQCEEEIEDLRNQLSKPGAEPRWAKLMCGVYAEPCSKHDFIHGAEAEELREGIEILVFRPSNNAVPAMLSTYRNLLIGQGASAEQVSAVIDLETRVENWRKAHPERCKVADVQPGELRT